MGQYKRIKITASVIGCTDLSFLTCPKMEAELAPSWSLWGFEGCLSGVHDNYHPTSCVRACKGLCTVLERYGFQKKRLRYSLMHSAHIVGEDLSRKSVHHFKTLAPQLTPPHLSANCELLVADSAGPSAWIQGVTGRLSWCFWLWRTESNYFQLQCFPSRLAVRFRYCEVTLAKEKWLCLNHSKSHAHLMSGLAKRRTRAITKP